MSKESTEQAALWIIAEVASQAEREGSPLTQQELEALQTPVWELGDADRNVATALNNRVVELARRAIERSKSEGAATTKVRRGLRLPKDWVARYNDIYENELPWAISGILQNALLGNPVVGEKRPWKSK